MYKKILSDFSAGVNFALAPLQLGLDGTKTAWANALNVEIFSRRGVCRQNGNMLIAQNPDGDGVNSLFTYEYQGGVEGAQGSVLPMNTVSKDGTTPILATAMCAYKSRLWLSAGDTLYFSALGMFDDWETVNDAGFISNFHCDSAPVNALAPYKDYIAIYKKAQTYLLSVLRPMSLP